MVYVCLHYYLYKLMRHIFLSSSNLPYTFL